MEPKDPSLESKMLRWLSDHGFPLEMRVADLFQAHGARVIQSEYFPDPSTGDAREVDVVASWQEQLAQTIVRLTFVVECKSSRDKPWVLFTAPSRLTSRASVSQRAATKLGRHFLRRAAGRTGVQELDLFSLPPETAYGGKPAFTEPGKPDVFYSAISSVCAAAAAETDYEDIQSSRTGQDNFCEVVFPIVVVDSRLFTARRSPDGSIALQEQASAVLVSRNPVLSMPHTIVDVVCADHIDEFVTRKASAVTAFLGMCSRELQTELTEALVRRELQRAKRSG